MFSPCGTTTRTVIVQNIEPPNPPNVVFPSSPSNDGNVSITLSERATTWKYSIDGGTNYNDGSGTSFTLTEGTYAAGSIKVTNTDADGNTSSATSNGTKIVIDKTAPTLSNISILSSNVENTIAKAGDTVTLAFTSNETINTPTIVFKSGDNTITNNVTINNSENNTWEASYTVADNDTDGDVSFTIDFTDTAGNNGTQVTATSNSSSVTIDTTGPVITLNGADTITLEKGTSY